MRDKTRVGRSKRHLDELTAWSTRQQAMKRTIARLEEQLKTAMPQKNLYVRLQRKITEMELDELKMIRAEMT